MTDQKNIQKTAQTPPKAIAAVRARSPSYPVLSLPAAIVKASALYEHIKRTSAPLETLATVWGSNAKSSATLQAVAALKKYGLLEELESAGSRLFKLTQASLTLILGDQTETPERLTLLKQLALSPQIHADIWKRFNGDLPSDVGLRQYLLLDKEFNENSVPGLIRSFRDTISFAKLQPSDKITSESDKSIEAESEENAEQTDGVNTTQTLPKPTPASQPAPPTFTSSGTVVVREVNFPLSTGVATLRVPAPITQEDFKNIGQVLGLFRDGLVSFPSVDCSTEDFEAQAESFADSKIEFNLVNFSYSHDIEFCRKLAVDYGFKFRFDPAKGLAFFRLEEHAKT